MFGLVAVQTVCYHWHKEKEKKKNILALHCFGIEAVNFSSGILICQNNWAASVCQFLPLRRGNAERFKCQAETVIQSKISFFFFFFFFQFWILMCHDCISVDVTVSLTWMSGIQKYADVMTTTGCFSLFLPFIKPKPANSQMWVAACCFRVLLLVKATALMSLTLTVCTRKCRWFNKVWWLEMWCSLSRSGSNGWDNSNLLIAERVERPGFLNISSTPA